MNHKMLNCFIRSLNVMILKNLLLPIRNIVPHHIGVVVVL